MRTETVRLHRAAEEDVDGLIAELAKVHGEQLSHASIQGLVKSQPEEPVHIVDWEPTILIPASDLEV